MLPTAKAWRIKEMLRWVRRAESKQAAKCRARGFRNDDTFISIIYLLAAPIQNLLKST
jgi:hypothetical protein